MAIPLDVPTGAERNVAMTATITEHVASGAPFASGHKVLAALSAWVYRFGHQPPSEATAPSWLSALDLDPLLPPANDRENGYDAFCFYAPKSEELVVVNRGSDSELDWILDIRAGVFDYDRTAAAALDYAVLAYEAARAKHLSIRRVTFTGQSLGGALAEAQAALFRPRTGASQLRAVCAGFASAPFGGAVQGLATRLGLAIDAPVLADSVHYIRKNDPIRVARHFSSWLSPVVSDDVNLYAVVRQVNGGGKDSFSTYTLMNLPIAHDSFLYYWFWDKAGPFHIVKHFKTGFQLWDGVEPRRLSLGRSLPPAYR
ncbi:MAG: hypothetical protein J7521_03600 [Caulobacter sp.]|nr:hypothetical protein [Caulobacter sp.]